jgi:predicted AlkP superfamily phosphohydrolase/phosphomutase
MNTKRILAIGLEAVEPSLLENWAEKGHLPNIAELMDKGSYTRMWGPAEVSSGATWSSINCGVTPGKHGMGFCHRQFLNGTYETRKKRADEVNRKPFWIQLDQNGKSVAVMDVPETKTYDLNGIEVVGWGLEYEAWHDSSSPKGLFDEITRRFGKHPFKGWYQTKPTSREEWKGLVEKLIDATKTRTEIWKHILSKRRYDFSLIAFAETHFGGHLFWHINDAAHPEYDEKLEAYLGHPLLEIYKLCDQAIGGFQEIDPEAIVSVWANTGMGPNYSARHFVAPVLKKLGYYSDDVNRDKGFNKLKPAADVYAVERIERLIGTGAIMFIKKLIPTRIWDNATRKYLSMGATWKDSRAFDIPGDNTGTIRINLKGREPSGLVEAQEYDKVCDEIKDAFMELKNPDTGEDVVKEVVRVRKKYSGDGNQDLPDLLVKWIEERPVTRIQSDRVGIIERDHLPDKRTGAHTDYGFFLISGDDVQRQVKFSEPMYNWDVAPTLLYLMGEEIPEDMDGFPKLEVVHGRFRETMPVRRTSMRINSQWKGDHCLRTK